MKPKDIFKVGDLVVVGGKPEDDDRMFRLYEGEMGIVLEVTGTYPWMMVRLQMQKGGEALFDLKELVLA